MKSLKIFVSEIAIQNLVYRITKKEISSDDAKNIIELLSEKVSKIDDGGVVYMMDVLSVIDEYMKKLKENYNGISNN